MDQVVAVMSAFPAPGCLSDAGFFSPHLTISTKQKSTHDAGEVCGKKGYLGSAGCSYELPVGFATHGRCFLVEVIADEVLKV
jgi:hypothetical protein